MSLLIMLILDILFLKLSLHSMIYISLLWLALLQLFLLAADPSLFKLFFISIALKHITQLQYVQFCLANVVTQSPSFSH